MFWRVTLSPIAEGVPLPGDLRMASPSGLLIAPMQVKQITLSKAKKVKQVKAWRIYGVEGIPVVLPRFDA